MRIRTASVLTITLCLTAAIAMSAQQQPISRTRSVSATATIQAIDPTARTVTLRDEQGNEDTYSVSPQVKRFNELKVGDTVKMTYHESLVLQVRKPGEAATVSDTAAVAVGKGALPSATMSAQDTVTVTVKAIDPAVPSVTVTTPDGRTVTRKIEDRKHLEGLKVGDKVDITYSRAVVTEIERPR